MENKRKLIRLEVEDFLQIRPLNETARVLRGKSWNFTLMGICFSSELEWKKGQVLLIEYFIPQELDSVKLKVVVIWSEFIDAKNGHFCGGEIIDVEEGKQDQFSSYYYQKLKEKSY